MPVEVSIPRLSWSMEHGVFVGWLKKDGERVRPGDALFTIEIEKGSQDVEAEDAGVLRRAPNGPQPGDQVEVGRIVGWIRRDGEAESAGGPDADDGPAALAPSRGEPAATPPSREMAPSSSARAGLSFGAPPEPAGRTSITATPRASLGAHDGPTASPRARRAARELRVDLRGLSGTGRNGRVRERDVISAAASARSAPSEPEGGPA